MERELRQARTELDNKSSEVKTLQGQIDRYKQDISKTEQQLKEQRVSAATLLVLGIVSLSTLDKFFLLGHEENN